MIRLISLYELKPHERIMQRHVNSLLKEILRDGSINIPVLIDANTKVILGGHHRFMVAKLLNLAKIPCLEVDYLNDNIISINSRRKEIIVTKADVIEAGINGKLFPNKTTKHNLLIPFIPVPTPLGSLVI